MDNKTGTSRTLKYLLNFVGLCLMTYLTFLSYAMIVNPRACERVMSVIWGNIKELTFFYAIFLGLITGLNYLIERKMEKRKISGEYLAILAINLTFLFFGAIYYSYEFYVHCRKA